MEVTVLAPAKINLTLDVLGKRFDGYHDVSMIMQAVSLYDEITVNTCETQGITISCGYPGVPEDSSNIAYKAAELFFDHTKITKYGVHIHIGKTIPTQAGLAGGSTDGAGVLLALNLLFRTALTTEELCRIGARAGADVPFCIAGGTQLAKGTGTELTKLPNMPKCHIVICKPELSVSTGEAYQKVDSLPPKGFQYTNEALKGLYRRDLRTLCTCMYNDFEQALQLEEITQIKRLMYKNKALGSCMSGSGSAVFGVFLTAKKADKCAELLKKQYRDVYVCTPLHHGGAVKSNTYE